MTKRKLLSNESVNDVYIVETICKKKIRSNKEPLYFIKWKDWDDKFNTWEPQSNILDKSLIDIFEEEQKEKHKIKKDPPKTVDLNVDKDSKTMTETIEKPTESQTNNEKSGQKCEIIEKIDKTCEIEIRPKICLKIPKHRIHPPCSDVSKRSSDINMCEQEIEKSRKSQNIDDDCRSTEFSLNYFSNDDCSINKSTKENSFRETKTFNKSDSVWSKQSHTFSEKSSKTFDPIIRKPRKLLSINEYSAKMKKHHKKSRSDKHRTEQKISMLFSYKNQNQNQLSIENKIEQKTESKAVRPQHERPLISLENQIETWSVKSVDKDLYSESVKAEEVKPIIEKFKYHANTIVTDVTIGNLSITIREMPYEDFIDDDTSRYLMIRVPILSDWLTRYRENSNKNINDDDDDCEIEEIEEIEETLQENTEEVLVKPNKKQTLLERFTECIIPGLRPPSRPRSVDSYKAAIDKNYLVNRNPFSATTSPMKISVDCQVQENIESCVPSNSSLHVIIDDCEEVDVVGGIESDHSFVGSLQSETVTVSTQIRQSLPINTSPVTSIIQSLLQSYSYNHSMRMPPLQAAPWLETHVSHDQLYHMPHHHNNNISLINNNNNNTCLQSNSMESSMLKYRDNACLMYHQPSNLLSEIYLNTSQQDTPIDLSFK